MLPCRWHGPAARSRALVSRANSDGTGGQVQWCRWVYPAPRPGMSPRVLSAERPWLRGFLGIVILLLPGVWKPFLGQGTTLWQS